MNGTHKPATLEDVARVSGFSRTTVSRVVNGVSTVDPVIAGAVERAIRKTGYSAEPCRVEHSRAAPRTRSGSCSPRHSATC